MDKWFGITNHILKTSQNPSSSDFNVKFQMMNQKSNLSKKLSWNEKMSKIFEQKYENFFSRQKVYSNSFLYFN